MNQKELKKIEKSNIEEILLKKFNDLNESSKFESGTNLTETIKSMLLIAEFFGL